MDPIKVAARFAAFACSVDRDNGQSLSPKQAARYARANWKQYLPYVDENLARFLSSPKAPRSHQQSAWAKQKT
jgi:hypothetical protein